MERRAFCETKEAKRLFQAIACGERTKSIREAARALIRKSGGNKTCLDETIDGGGSTAMILATANDRVGVVGMLFEEGASIDRTAGPGGSSALHVASRFGLEAMVHHLISLGAAIDPMDETGATPLHDAAWAGHGRVVEKLLSADADPNLATTADWTPLHAASGGGHLGIVQQLLLAGAERDPADEGGSTPLHEACEAGHAAVARQLLACGADSESRDTLSRTALHFAAHHGHLSTVSVLLAAGACIDAVGGEDMFSPLFLASQGGHCAVVEALLSAGATVDLLTTIGSAPLHVAASKGHAKVIRVLVHAGAKVDRIRGSPPKTALLDAASRDNEEAVQELLAAGASVAEALARAREQGLDEVVRGLVAADGRFFDSLDVADMMRICHRVVWETEGRSPQQAQGGPLQRGIRPEALDEIAVELLALEGIPSEELYL